MQSGNWEILIFPINKTCLEFEINTVLQHSLCTTVIFSLSILFGQLVLSKKRFLIIQCQFLACFFSLGRHVLFPGKIKISQFPDCKIDSWVQFYSWSAQFCNFFCKSMENFLECRLKTVPYIENVVSYTENFLTSKSMGMKRDFQFCSL